MSIASLATSVVTRGRETLTDPPTGKIKPGKSWAQLADLKVEIQELSGTERQMAYGQEEASTHDGIFAGVPDVEVGDVLKATDGPEAGEWFRVTRSESFRGHHVESLLRKDPALKGTPPF